MRARRPHYFLRTQAAAPPAPPRWAFSLEAGDQSPAITAGDLEPHASWERLQLLAVVRGLEALPEPALVTLSTASDVVRRGIRFGLEEWRALDWQLEHFGELIPVKNSDLWRRIDRALAIHDVQIRNVRVDEPIIAVQSEQPHFAQVAAQARRGQPRLAASVASMPGSSTNGFGLSGGETWSADSPTTPEHWKSASLWNAEEESDDEFSRNSPAIIPQRVAQQLGTLGSNLQKSIRDASHKTLPISGYSSKACFPSLAVPLLRIRRRIRASRLHLMRRIGELWRSWVWFYEVSGLQQMTRQHQPIPPPWLRDAQIRENPHCS